MDSRNRNRQATHKPSRRLNRSEESSKQNFSFIRSGSLQRERVGPLGTSPNILHILPTTKTTTTYTNYVLHTTTTPCYYLCRWHPATDIAATATDALVAAVVATIAATQAVVGAAFIAAAAASLAATAIAVVLLLVVLQEVLPLRVIRPREPCPLDGSNVGLLDRQQSHGIVRVIG